MGDPERKCEFTYRKKLVITILISLLVHLVFILFYAFPYIVIFPQWLQQQPEEPPAVEPEKEVVFELVDTPDDADQTDSPKDTRFVSDKSAMARDANTEADKPVGDAFADGNFDVSEYTVGQLDEPALGNPAVESAPAEKPPTEAEAEEQIEPQEKEPATESSWSRMHFYALPDNPNQEAFLQQFERTQDRRPLRKNNPLRRQTETSARNIGGFSLDTYAWSWAPYLQQMRDKVQRNLFPPAAFTRLGIINGESLIRFKVFPDGHVEDIEVLSYEGHRSLMETSVNAIKGAEPFQPLPGDFPKNKEFLGVTAHFQYFISR